MEEEFESEQFEEKFESEQEERNYYSGYFLHPMRNLWIEDEQYKRLYSVLCRLPISVVRQMTEREIAVFAPDPNSLGRSFQSGIRVDPGQRIIYLSPKLWSLSPEEIEATIAHELAHAVLGHTEEPCADAFRVAMAGEEAADNLVESWGFEIPPNMKRH